MTTHHVRSWVRTCRSRQHHVFFLKHHSWQPALKTKLLATLADLFWLKTQAPLLKLMPDILLLKITKEKKKNISLSISHEPTASLHFISDQLLSSTKKLSGEH